MNKSKQTLKVGDRVKVIKKNDHYNNFVGVIVDKSKCWDWRVEFNEIYQGDYVGFYYESELQLITPKKEVKKWKLTRKQWLIMCSHLLPLWAKEELLAKQSTPKKKSKEIKEIKKLDMISITTIDNKLDEMIDTINLLIKNK